MTDMIIFHVLTWSFSHKVLNQIQFQSFLKWPQSEHLCCISSGFYSTEVVIYGFLQIYYQYQSCNVKHGTLHIFSCRTKVQLLYFYSWKLPCSGWSGAVVVSVAAHRFASWPEALLSGLYMFSPSICFFFPQSTPKLFEISVRGPTVYRCSPGWNCYFKP